MAWLLFMGKRKSKRDAVGDGTADIPQTLFSLPHVCGVICYEPYAAVPRADDHPDHSLHQGRVSSSSTCPLASRKYTPRPPCQWLSCMSASDHGLLPYGRPAAWRRPKIASNSSSLT